MDKKPEIIDERTIAVADTSYRFAWMVLAFGVMVVVVVRGLAFHQSCWDLLGLTFLSSMVATIYQRIKHVQTLPRHVALLVIMIAMVVGLASVFVAMRFLKH
jgi:hypothetical protein